MRNARSAALLAATALVLPGAVAARASGPAAPPRIGRVTEITAKGNVAATVEVPRTTDIADFRLYVKDATVAIVRLVPEKQPECDRGRPNCNSWEFRYVRELSRFWSYAPAGSGRDHQALVPDPSRVPYGRLRVYVVTDGSVVFRMAARDGRLAPVARVVARDRIRASAQRIGLRCAPACAGPAQSGVGGAVFDLQGSGYVAFIAARIEDTPGNSGLNASYAAIGCYYPNPLNAAGSPNPADHPDGCDTVPRHQEELWPTAVGTATMTMNLLPVSSGHIRSEWWTGARGRVYVGGVTRSISPVPSRGLVLGIWIKDSPPR